MESTLGNELSSVKLTGKVSSMELAAGKESSQFARWLDREGNLFEYSGQAPSPSKDFCQIVVTHDQIIFRWWRITHRNAETQRLSPGEIKECHEDFLHDDRTQSMIMCAFGQTMVDYVVNLCQGHIDYMQRLPHNVVRRILGYTELEDIAKVSVVNKTFHKICNNDELWRELFSSITTITEDLESLARDQGWKKLFFSNKLQIQMQLRRKRRTDAGVITPAIDHKDLGGEGGGAITKKAFLTHNYHDEVLPKH